jgi:hypothetical protein
MAFEQTVRILRDQVGAPGFQRLHARIARQELARVLGGFGADRPTVTRFVDGREGAPEDSVKLYGVIRYEFARTARIATEALQMARDLSPAKSGLYKRSWFLMVDGREVRGKVPLTAREVTLTNDVPYHRKLEMTVGREAVIKKGIKTFRRMPGIVERVRQQLVRKYGDTFLAEIRFIDLADAYVLKGRGRTFAAKQNRRSSAYRAGRARTMVKKDRRAGQRMTYPALVIRPRYAA